MKISRESLRSFREDFRSAVSELEEKYGVTIQLGNISYDESMFSARLEVKNSRDPEEIAEKDFDRDVWKYEHLGFREGMYKRVFIGADGDQYTIVGFNTRASKSALHIVRVRDGRRFAAREGFVKRVTDEVYTTNLSEDAPAEKAN